MKSPLACLILLLQLAELLVARLDLVGPLWQLLLHSLSALLPGAFRLELLQLALLVMN